MELAAHLVRQRLETCELYGVEGANRYDVLSFDGRRVLHAAEREGGFWDGVVRQLGGHTVRTFHVDVFDPSGRAILTMTHPPAWFLQRVEIRTGHGRLLGTFEECFSWLDKKLVVKDAHGRVILTSTSWLLTPWDFAFSRAAPRSPKRVAMIEKQWSGIGRELFSDADTFQVRYESRSLDADERALLLAAALFVDLVWFERPA